MDTPGVIPTAYARMLGMSREFTADPSRAVMEADLSRCQRSMGGGGGGGAMDGWLYL